LQASFSLANWVPRRSLFPAVPLREAQTVPNRLRRFLGLGDALVEVQPLREVFPERRRRGPSGRLRRGARRTQDRLTSR